MAVKHVSRFRPIAQWLLAASLLIALVNISPVGASPWPSPQKEKKSKKKKGGKGPVEQGTPALWEDRGDIASLNLVYGIGSEEGMPKPPFQFDKEDITGTNPKIKILDANGIKWNVKFDEEVHAEVVSSRIVWACGYMVEESYFIPSGKVEGVNVKLDRARKFVGSDGSFTNAMFEKRPEDVTRRGVDWTWTSNPFVGTKELSGLAILIALLNNWDAKPTNNDVLAMFDDKGSVKEWYTVTDWGGSFGRLAGFLYSKWSIEHYTRRDLLSGVADNSLKLNYSGKMSSGLKTVPLDHARWFAGIVGKLSDQQIKDAFQCAGATEEETRAFGTQMRKKINELLAAVGQK